MHLLSLITHTCYIVYIAINNIQESCNAQGQKRLPIITSIQKSLNYVRLDIHLMQIQNNENITF